MTSTPAPSTRSTFGQSLLVLLALLAGLGSMLLPNTALAQTTIDLEVAATTVEVGQPFVVQMQALSSEGAPENPRLKLSADFSIQGPNVGSNHQVSFVNGRIQRRTGISATWQLIAKRTGVFSIGPASAQTSGGQVESRAVSVKVVAAGTLQRPQRRGGLPFDDDDLFGGLGGFGRRRSLLDEMLGRAAGEEPTPPPPEFNVETAPDDRAFVRAVVHPQTAVVGQQVTLDVYAYGSLGRFRENSPHEPRRTDFYSYSLIENSTRQPTYVVRIGDTDFYAIRVRRFALFPLKAGELEIGPMEMSFYGSAYVTRKAQEGLPRKSNALTVHVTEPDATTRPLGYQLGDVGEFKLEAKVAPTQIAAGDSVSVSATLEGIGNLPGHLLTPEQKGVTWLEPTINGESKQVSEGVIGGVRSFTYVVKLENAGKIDLGELKLPHYNPRTGQYAIASAKLGVIEVTAKADSTPATAETVRAPLTAGLTPEKTLGPAVTREAPLPSRPWFWWLTFGMPALVIAAQGLQRGGTRLLTRMNAERSSLARQAKESLAEAKSLGNQGELKSAFSALERALYLCIESQLGVRGRGMLQPELARALQKAGLSESLCGEIGTLFTELDQLRFAPQAQGAAEIVQRAERTIAALNSSSKSSKARAET